MDTTTINGLHACKPGNEPQIGQIKTFVVQHMTGKSGKPYLKIKSANEENGGTPHRILAAEPTGYTDSYGNISFNVEIEVVNGVQKAPVNALQGTQDASNGGGQVKTYSPLDEIQRAIIRQHSQSMSLEVLKLKATLNELSVEDLTPAKLKTLADYFDNDVIGAAL